MESLKRSRSGGAELEEDTAKRSCIEDFRPPTQLPPEMWELIFRNLNAYWLRKVRLVCRSWYKIIRGSPRLMDKFFLTLTTANFKVDRESVRNLLATGGGYTQATLAFFGIGRFKPRMNWLKPLGATLHTLSLELTGTEVFLTQVLKEMPNLKQLNIKASTTSQFQAVNRPDFRLEKLTELTISHYPTPDVLSYCRQVCSKLTIVRLLFPNNVDFDDEIVDLVRANCKTLQELTVKVSEEIVDCLVKFKDLRLKRLSVGKNGDGSVHDILRLIKQQPSLEQLNVTTWITSRNFYEIISVLPNLQTLEVNFDPQNTPQTLSLKNMSHIESLTIKHGYHDDVWHMRPVSHPLELTNCDLTRLQHLSLHQCNLSREALSDLQRTKISRLTLDDCAMGRLSDLLLLKSLKHVELCGASRIRDLSEPTAEEDDGSSIRSLKASNVDRTQFPAIVKIFPNLERFEGDSGSTVNGDVLKALSERSPMLKEISVCIGFYWSDTSFRNGMKRFGALKTIRVECYDYERTIVTYALCGINATFELYPVAPENEAF